MATRTDPLQKLANEIAEETFEQRKNLHLTMTEVARRAGVSVRMIVRQENPAELQKVLVRIQQHDNIRQKRALTKVFVQIAAALEVEDVLGWVIKAQLYEQEDPVLLGLTRKALGKQRASRIEYQTHRAQLPIVVLQPIGAIRTEPIIIERDLYKLLVLSINPKTEVVKYDYLLEQVKQYNLDSSLEQQMRNVIA